jgi:hypothetical protein
VGQFARIYEEWLDYPSLDTLPRAAWYQSVDDELEALADHFFHSRKYGVVANGSADDTSALAEWAQAISEETNHGLAFLQAGIAMTSAQVDITADTCTIHGAGLASNLVSGGSRIQARSDFSGENVMKIAGPDFETTSIGAVTLRDFMIDGFGAGSPFEDCNGLFWGVYRGIIENVQINRVQGVGLKVDGSGPPVLPLGAWDNFFTNVYVAQTGGDGIQLIGGASDNMLTTCYVLSNGGHSVYCEEPGNQFINCYLGGCGGYGIYTTSPQQFRVNGCRFRESNGGIYVTNTVVSGPFHIGDVGIKNASQATHNTYDGIVIDPAFTLRGGTIADITFNTNAEAAGKLMRYGVNIADALAVGVSVSGLTEGYTGESATFGTGMVAPDLGTNTIWNYRDLIQLGSTAKVRFGSAGPFISQGTGTPEGVVTAPMGSLFLRTDGGASTTLYVKTSGAGNTGWTAK